MSDPLRSQPAVVFGFPRSGTTLLSRVLDTHPEISCPPETNLLSACGRFLRESSGEGPPLGVLSGLALAGIPETDVLDALRTLVFGFHARLAAGKPVWVEKSGFDIFYLDAIERLMAGHCRFICLIRHPLDVVASVKDLVDKAGHCMPELREHLLRHDSAWVAYASAWIDRAEALASFRSRHPDDSLLLRYEDMVADPVAAFGRVAAFLGVAAPDAAALDAALTAAGRIGLGDWRVFERRGIDAASVGRWRQAIPRATAARLIAMLAPWFTTFGYDVPPAARVPDRADALRHFTMAKRVQLASRRAP